MKTGAPMVKAALLFALLLGSLTLVVWRQSHALAMLRELEAVRHERVVAEAHRAALSRHLEELESRGRVSKVVRERFGMRLPSGTEIVILPLREPASALAVRGPETGAGEG